MRSQRRGNRGFSLVEMLVVVAIVGALASIGLPLTELAQRRTKEFTLRRALREIRAGIDAYKQAFDEGHILQSTGDSGYPATLDLLTQGVTDVRSPQGKKIYFLRRLPRDPFADPLVERAADTWALRSYASPPDDPQPGKDVFDIHSRSNQLSLQGEPYSAW